jgi:hypothetical protein
MTCSILWPCGISPVDYQAVRKGKAPKNAPTCEGDVKAKDTTDEKSVEVTMQKYVCNVCGYV